jgi:hypothetical protein
VTARDLPDGPPETTVTDDPTHRTDPTGSPTVPKPRRKTVVLAVVALLAIAVPAAAQTAFRDVPSSYVHAGPIQQLRQAGVTDGCGDGTRYCPTDPVTRAQMASFLTRGGSQAFADQSVTTLTAGSGNVNGVPVVVDVTGAGTGGGRQHVVLQGSVTVHHDGAVSGCPCEVEAYVYRARGSVEGPSSWAVLGAEPATGSGTSSVSLPVTWATTMEAGRTESFRVAVFVDGTAQSGMRAEGSLTAVTAPFGRVPSR